MIGIYTNVNMGSAFLFRIRNSNILATGAAIVGLGSSICYQLISSSDELLSTLSLAGVSGSILFLSIYAMTNIFIKQPQEIDYESIPDYPHDHLVDLDQIKMLTLLREFVRRGDVVNFEQALGHPGTSKIFPATLISELKNVFPDIAQIEDRQEREEAVRARIDQDIFLSQRFVTLTEENIKMCELLINAETRGTLWRAFDLVQELLDLDSDVDTIAAFIKVLENTLRCWEFDYGALTEPDSQPYYKRMAINNLIKMTGRREFELIKKIEKLAMGESPDVDKIKNLLDDFGRRQGIFEISGIVAKLKRVREENR